MTDVYAAALAYLRAGWTPTPVVSKVPVLQDWPTRTVSEADAYSFWGEGTYTGIGIVCGAPSGNLLVIDIEGRLAGDQQRLAAIWAKAAELGVDQLLGAAMSGACATTPSGGRHLFLRCTDGPVPGNVKLCYRLEDDGRTTSLLAETRGAGGQVAAWPAPGREWLGTSGPGSALPVTSVQLGLVLDAFRWIDEAQRLPAPTSRPRSSTFEAPRSLTVAQALNESLMADEMSWLDVLDPGWTHTGYDRSGRSMWLRPDYGDKSTALNSAHGLEKFEGGPTPVLVVHSNSVRHLPTGDGQRLTPGRVMAYCWFEGNEAAAYAALEEAVKGGEVHPAVARLPRPTLERVVEVVKQKLPKPPEAPALAPAPSPSAVQSQPAPVGEGPVEGDGTSVSRTTWYAVDLSAALAGVWSDPPPVALRRADGVAMFYRGKVNGLLGESESGKTWVGLVAVKQDLEAGEHVLIIDFEDAARGVVGRLKALGAITAETLPRLVYIRPDESFSMSAAADLGEILDSRPFGLVLVDGVNAAMQTMGFDINSNNDATAFYQRLLHPIAKRGPAVVTIDHVPKSQEARGKGGIGAQAKRGMIDGAAIRVEALHPFGRGQTGELRLTADKDRPGQVRENAVEAKYLGIFELVSDADTGQVTYTFHPPQHTSGPFRPTLIMQRISDALALLPEGASKNTIEGAVKGRAEHIRIALERLQDEGYVALSPGARKGQLVLKLVKPFDPLAMPEPEMEAIARAYYDEGEDD